MGTPANGDKKNIVKLAYLYFQEGRWDNAVEEYKKLLELDPEDINIHNMLGDVYVKKNSAMEAYEEYSKVVADLINRGQVDKATLINKKIARLDPSQLAPEAQQKQNLILLHVKAEEALLENRVEEAVDFYSQILKLDSEDLIVAAKLAELEEKTGRVNDAVEQYNRIGESFLNSHLFKKAQEMFKKVVAIDPQNTAAHLQLAKIYIKQGSESDAKKEYLNIAEYALAKDELDNALEYARKAVELKSIEAHYVVGIVLFKRQKWAEAKVEFDDLLRFKLNHVGALVYLGKVHAAMDQSEKAAETFQKALKIDKDSVVALEAWAEYCVKKKNKTEAIQTLNTLVDKAIAENEMERAVELARNIILVDETLVASKLRLAEIFQKIGDVKGSANVYYQLALIHEQQNKPQDAAQYVRKTLEIDPAHEKALAMASQSGHGASSAQSTVLSTPKANQEKIENVISKIAEAEQAKPRIVEVSPQEALKAQLAVADQYVKQGLLDEAIDIYQQLSEVYPENLEIKSKLNGVYTAYAKTGTDLTSVLIADSKIEADPVDDAKKADETAKKDLKDLEIKAREEADKKVKVELEKRAREEAEKKAHEEVEKKNREETQKKAREETEKKAREEAEKRNHEEAQRKAREEAEKIIRDETEKRIREELEKKAREEVEKKTRAEAEKKAHEEMESKIREEVEKKVREEMTKRSQNNSMSLEAEKKVSVGGLDDMVVIAEADLLNSQGNHEEAAKIYRKVLEKHPDHQEVIKKLGVVEDILKSKTASTSVLKAPPVLKVVESPTSSPPPNPPSDPEKDSNIKKKSNKIGYV
jgi:tetratricopeptide (TPR) repeat protein